PASRRSRAGCRPPAARQALRTPSVEASARSALSTIGTTSSAKAPCCFGLSAQQVEAAPPVHRSKELLLREAGVLHDEVGELIGGGVVERILHDEVALQMRFKEHVLRFHIAQEHSQIIQKTGRLDKVMKDV